MEDDFIKYEQALALKELGFNKPCLAMFRYPLEFKMIKNKTGYPSGCKNSKLLIEESVAAPLYQQAFRFFRDKYNLHAHICYLEDSKVWNVDIYKLNSKNGGLMNDPMQLTGYKTYEEAELACLKKLIEIVKNM